MKTRVIIDYKKSFSFRKILPYSISLFVATILLVVLLSLRQNVAVCEKITREVTVIINGAVGSAGAKVSFSLFETFLLISVGVLLVWVARSACLLFTRQVEKCARSFLILATVCVLFGSYYMFTSGFAYNREELPSFYEGSPSYYEFYDAVKYFKEDFDALASKFERDENGCVISPYSLDELNELFYDEIERLSNVVSGKPFACKELKITSRYFFLNGITGITFTPTGDCGLNVYQPPSELTATAAHEIMHSLGVMRERDANALSCYLLISSTHDYLRYCGYYNYYYYLLTALSFNYDKNEYNAVYPCKEVVKETAYQRELWASRSSIFDEIGDFFNSLYLKLSGVKEGTANYYSETGSGGKYEERERVFVEVEYNEFQRAFLKVYYEK